MLNNLNPDYKTYGPGLYFYIHGTFTKFFPENKVSKAGAYRRDLLNHKVCHFAVLRGLNDYTQVISGLYSDGVMNHRWEDDVAKAICSK